VSSVKWAVIPIGRKWKATKPTHPFIDLNMRLFHRHKWELVESKLVKVYDGTKDPVEFHYVEIQRCKDCGKIRKQMVKF